MDEGAVVFLVVFVAAIWLVFGMIGANIAASKQARDAGFLLGLFLGPIGLIIAALIDNRPKCPECGGRVEPGVRRCMHCGTQLAQRATQPLPVSLTKPDRADAPWWQFDTTETRAMGNCSGAGWSTPPISW